MQLQDMLSRISVPICCGILSDFIRSRLRRRGHMRSVSAAYPAAQAIVPDLTYVRRVTLKKSSNTVVLEDHTNAQDVILNFITYEKPVILSDGKLSIGEASASFEGADLLAIETLPITDARLKTAWDHDLYRIRLKGSDAGFRLTIQ